MLVLNFGKEGRPVVLTVWDVLRRGWDLSVCIYLSSGSWETWNVFSEGLAPLLSSVLKCYHVRFFSFLGVLGPGWPQWEGDGKWSLKLWAWVEMGLSQDLDEKAYQQSGLSASGDAAQGIGPLAWVIGAGLGIKRTKFKISCVPNLLGPPACFFLCWVSVPSFVKREG